MDMELIELRFTEPATLIAQFKNFPADPLGTDLFATLSIRIPYSEDDTIRTLRARAWEAVRKQIQPGWQVAGG